MKFKRYEKIHALHKSEVDGILDGFCFVQEKIDGANTSIWLDEGKICKGSRNMYLESGFNGFCEYVDNHEGINALLRDNPEYRLYGEWLCLSGDTIIRKTSGGRATGGAYMTIREMYKYLKTPLPDRNESWWEKNGFPSLYSLFQDKDLILPNKIKNIVYSGEKMVYEIVTRKGCRIKASKSHPFLKNTGWTKLEALTEGDCVAVSELRTVGVSRNLGTGSRKILAEQKTFKEDSDGCKLCGSKESLELDHIDENFLNNDKKNWQVLCSNCHKSKSGYNKKTKPHAKGYTYEFDKIISIKKIGVEDTYDIEMEGEENEANFVAQNFIVHNCKHTISYKETNYNHFYLFDIEFGDKFLSIDEVYNLAIQYKIRTPHLFGYFENPTLEDLKEIAGRSVLGERGEGIVIKNMDFINQFYRNDYAKLVTEKFKESNSITFGGNNKKAESYWELYIVNKYITLARVKKILNKIQSLTEEKLDMKHIPRVVGTTYNDMLTEEIWEIQKKVPVLNFKTLKRLSLLKIKQIYIDILNDDISVADKPNDEKE